MYLKRLKLIHFKNYAGADLEFSPKINCFVGGNGAGKTNLLDAIYYLSFTRSCFNSIDSQNIRHGEEFFAIHGDYMRNEAVGFNIHCIQKRGQNKEFVYNQDRYDRMADHIGLIPLVIVSPYDRDLINDGSEFRRKYIDGVISQFSPAYLNDLLTYNKALASRNALLRQFGETRSFDSVMLEAYQPVLVETGTRIFETRRDFLKTFVPKFDHFYRVISGKDETVGIEYLSQLSEDSLDNLLIRNLEKDRATRYTNTGIHKDDLEFSIGGYPVKRFGSQGQQKSFVIAIKLAQFEYTSLVKNFKPILLFDDIFDKLDTDRVETLIGLVGKESFGQVFITDTQPGRIRNIFEQTTIDHRIFRVNNGEAGAMDVDWLNY